MISREEKERAREALARARKAKSLDALLEACGRSIAMGDAIDSFSVDAPQPIALGAEALDATSLIEALANEDEARAIAMLKLRTDLELRKLGARFLEIEIAEEEIARLSDFDDVIEPFLWKLVSLNESRGEMLVTIAPEKRGSFPWLARGAGIDPRAVSALPSVAELVARFPEASMELDDLVRTARSLEKPTAKIVVLSDWIARKSEQLRVAAAPTSRDLLLVEPGVCEIHLRSASTLVVDLLVEGVARLRLDDGRAIAPSEAPGTLGRHVFDLDVAALARRATLVIETHDRTIELFLPPDA